MLSTRAVTVILAIVSNFIVASSLNVHVEPQRALCNPVCTSTQCLTASCTASAPFLCVSPSPGQGNCSATPWPFTSTCTECCDFTSCFLDCSTPCNDWQCSVCTRATSTTMCTAGSSAQQCSMVDNWAPSGGCAACCNTTTCEGGPTPPPPPPTNPPVLTPVPGWTMAPTDFPPPTPLPVAPTSTPTPSGRCSMCSTNQCSMPDLACGRQAPFLCLTGSASGACLNTPWETSACTSCCDYTECLPPPPTPFPPSPWDLVPPSANCSSQSALPFAPDSAATPYGGVDVSALGCRASVSEDCCGVTPRFNWVLAMCHPNASLRHSMACNHTFGNTSVAEIYYIKAYQWNSDGDGGWVVDPTSSFQASSPGDTLDFSSLNLTLMTPHDNQDWDLKYGPTTAAQATNGLGPPAMLFLLSARELNWITFYALNQITMNRGPGGEHYADNCWSSSAGEFDFLEAPFWGGISLPPHHLYTTITSGTGRCLPVQKMVSKRFQRECNDRNCCQMCSCPPDFICVGDPRYIGYEPMSCIHSNQSIPHGMQAFTVGGSSIACGAYFSAVPGGSQSTSFFADETHSNATEVIVAAVVDADGVTVYRWPSSNESAAATIWPGIGKYDAAATLQASPSHRISPKPPCTDLETPCSLHVPSCGDECALISASGQFGPSQLAGAYAAECARDNLNWWNVFASTNQTVGMQSDQLAMYVDVPTVPVPMPFSCNSSCDTTLCHTLTRCTSIEPFMCTSGDALNDCSAVPSHWPLSGHCSACCNVDLCDVACSSSCTPEQCATTDCDPQLNPFFCVSGPLEGACSSSQSFFPQQPGCYSCCDSTSCSPS